MRVEVHSGIEVEDGGATEDVFADRDITCCNVIARYLMNKI